MLLIIAIPKLSLENYKEVLIEIIPNKNGNYQLVTKINKIITSHNKVYFPTNEKNKLQLVNDTCIQDIFNEHMTQCKFERIEHPIIKPITKLIVLTANIKKQKLLHNCNTQDINIEKTHII